MNDITNWKTMTVKDVSEILGVSRQLISGKVKELFPEIVRNGIETKLNENQVTIIKLNIEKNPMIPYTIVEGMPKSNLEKQLIIKQAMIIQQELIKELQKEKQQLENKVNQLIHNAKLYTSTEIAKELNLKSAVQLNKILEEKGIQYKVNGTWVLTAMYSDEGLESIKQEQSENCHIHYIRNWTGKGRDFILNYFALNKLIAIN